MADNTVSLYIPSPLFEQARQAQADGVFKIKDVCVAALEATLKGNPYQPALGNQASAQALADDAAEIEYVLQYKPDLGAAQAMIDNVASQGGWPISVSPTATGEGFWMLFAFPKAFDEDNAGT